MPTHISSNLCKYKDPDHTEFLQLLQWTFRHTNDFFHKLHAEGIWIPLARAQVVLQHGYNSAEPWFSPLVTVQFVLNLFWKICLKFLYSFCWILVSYGQRKEGFVALARVSLQHGWALFKIRPKLHMYVHVPNLSCKIFQFLIYGSQMCLIGKT